MTTSKQTPDTPEEPPRPPAQPSDSEAEAANNSSEQSWATPSPANHPTDPEPPQAHATAPEKTGPFAHDGSRKRIMAIVAASAVVILGLGGVALAATHRDGDNTAKGNTSSDRQHHQNGGGDGRFGGHHDGDGDHGPVNDATHVFGQVTKVENNVITVTDRSGTTRTITTSADTKVTALQRPQRPNEPKAPQAQGQPDATTPTEVSGIAVGMMLQATGTTHDSTFTATTLAVAPEMNRDGDHQPPPGMSGNNHGAAGASATSVGPNT